MTGKKQEPPVLELLRHIDKAVQIVTGKQMSHYAQRAVLGIFPVLARIDTALRYEKPKDPNDPYNILDIPSTSPDWLVKIAYQNRARQAHPDHGGSNEEMKKLNAAYDIIKKARGLT